MCEDDEGFCDAEPRDVGDDESPKNGGFCDGASDDDESSKGGAAMKGANDHHDESSKGGAAMKGASDVEDEANTASCLSICLTAV